MENIISLAITISVVYFFTRFIEMRFIKKESDSIQVLFKDSLLVLISSGLGIFIFSQLSNLVFNKNTTSSETLPAFTSAPDF